MKTATSTRTLSGLLLALLVGLAGCDQGGTGRVAILDLDRVARATGHRKMMESADKQFQAKLFGELQATSKKFTDEYKAKEKEFGKKPTEAQKKTLAEMNSKMRLAVMRQRDSLGQRVKMNQYQLYEQFKQFVKTFAQTAAADRGLTVVIISSRMQNDPILLYDESSDVTDEVIQAILENQSTAGPSTGAGPGGGTADGGLNIPPPSIPGPPGTDKGTGPGNATGTPAPGPAPAPGKTDGKTDAKAPAKGDAPAKDDAKAPAKGDAPAPAKDDAPAKGDAPAPSKTDPAPAPKKTDPGPAPKKDAPKKDESSKDESKPDDGK